MSEYIDDTCERKLRELIKLMEFDSSLCKGHDQKVIEPMANEMMSAGMQDESGSGGPMESELGVGGAALSALAAEGKDFSREKLNAMLVKLAVSPVPKLPRPAMAMCYSMAEPRPETDEYVCRKCGTHTIYPVNRLQMANKIARFRDEAAHLRALGLDITLDETPLCAKCKTAKELGFPVSGTIVGTPTGKEEKKSFPFAVGDKVAINNSTFAQYQVAPLHKEYWVQAKYLSESGHSLGGCVEVRQAPRIGSFVHAKCFSFDSLERLPARPGDPPDWVRVAVPQDGLVGSGDVSICQEYVGELSYDEGDSPSLRRFTKLAWIITGKRTIAHTDDAKILEAFLTGQDVRDAGFGEKRALKFDIMRLRELLDTDFAMPGDGGEASVGVGL